MWQRGEEKERAHLSITLQEGVETQPLLNYTQLYHVGPNRWIKYQTRNLTMLFIDNLIYLGMGHFQEFDSVYGYTIADWSCSGATLRLSSGLTKRLDFYQFVGTKYHPLNDARDKLKVKEYLLVSGGSNPYPLIAAITLLFFII